MKIVESWLREWVSPDLDTEALAERLTMAGHEVDSIEIQGTGLDGVIVAEVLDVEKHPDADRLSVCQVSTGSGNPVEVVCGAPNVTSLSELAVPPQIQCGFQSPSVRIADTQPRLVLGQAMAPQNESRILQFAFSGTLSQLWKLRNFVRH